jgi:membrane protein DedA with SNARE-associated domain
VLEHHHLLPHPFGTRGYLAIFLVVAIESLGVPLPGETALLAGAALAASGRLSLIGVMAAAAAGALVGGGAGYTIGRVGGAPFLERYGRFLRLTPERLQRMHDFFARHGPEAVFFGRFIALLRTWAAILAGTARMPLGAFLLYTSLGAVVWSALFGLIGYYFGRSLPTLEHNMGIATLCLLCVVVVAGAIYLFRERWKQRRTVNSTGNR